MKDDDFFISDNKNEEDDEFIGVHRDDDNGDLVNRNLQKDLVKNNKHHFNIKFLLKVK